MICYVDTLVLKLLSNDVSKLLDVLLVVYQKEPSIIHQVTSSLCILSYSNEGNKYLKNTPDLMDHLKMTLSIPTNLKETYDLTTIVLEKLGCVIK